MKVILILILLLQFNFDVNSEWKKIQFWTIGELTTAPLIIEGKIEKIDSQFVSIKVIDVLKGKLKSNQIKLANNFYTNYALEIRSDKGMHYWELGENKIFFISKAYYDQNLLKREIFRTFNTHDDSERKIINQKGEKKIELSYGLWVNSILNAKYENLKTLNKNHRKRIQYSYHEMKEAIVFFAKNRKKIQRKVRKTIKRNQHFDSIGRRQWNGVIENKYLINLKERGSSFERLLDEYFDNLYKETW